MCLLVLIRQLFYGHVIDSLEKNLSLYLIIGAWFVTSLVMYIHIEFKELKCFSQALSLVYVRQIKVLSLLFSSRKFLSLYSDAWKYICYLHKIESHSSFLLNSYDNKYGLILKHLDSLSTSKCGDYSTLSRQSTELLELLLKNFSRFFDIAIEYNWYRWIIVLKICLTAGIASVIPMMCLMSYKCVILVKDLLLNFPTSSYSWWLIMLCWHNNRYDVKMRVFCQRKIPNITKYLLVSEPHLIIVSNLEREN